MFDIIHVLHFKSEDCKESEFQCNSGKCIPKTYLCNGIENDCEQNEDENTDNCESNGKTLLV